MKKIFLTHQLPTLLMSIVITSLLFVGCETETFSDPDDTSLSTVETGIEVNQISVSDKGGNTSEFVTNLMAGQHHVAGTLSVSTSEDNLVVTYKTNTKCTDSTSSWTLKATHLYVGACEKMPVTRKGNPKIGKFPFKTEHGEGVSEFTYTIPLADLDKCFCIAAHAEVDCGDCDETEEEETEGEGEGEGKNSDTNTPDDGEKERYCGEETAWAEGTEFKGNSWAMYLEFCVDTDTETETEGEGEGE